MSDILLDQIKQHRKGIKHETLTFSLAELVNMYERTPREIVIQPDFQRLFRWTREQQSNFITAIPQELERKRLEVFSGPATRQVNEKPKTSNRVQVQYCPSALQLYSQPPGA